jgi:hypothetical protein
MRCAVATMTSRPPHDQQHVLAALWRSVAARILRVHYLASRGQYSPAR